MDMQLTHFKNTLRQHQPLYKQVRGGTMLGIIIGVLVGLGAALAVAVYVAKVPVPFVNKSQPKAADQDAAEAKKNKDWDPNAPLYGKNQGKTPGTAAATGPTVMAAPAPAKPGDKAVAAAPAAPVPATPKATATPPAAAPAAQPGSADPLGDLAKAKTAAARTAGSTAAGADPFTYSVQAGAYRTPEDAETQRAKLGMLGFDAKISEREQSGHTVYRVRVGPFDKKEDAEKSKEKLDGNGVDTALVRVQR